MNRMLSWRKSILTEPATHNTQGNYGQQGSSHDFRGRVYNLDAPILRYTRYPWVPQYNWLEPFTVPTRQPNPSPGVRQLQQTSRPQRTLGPLKFSPAGTASINSRGW